jgi:hypothetical protein
MLRIAVLTGLAVCTTAITAMAAAPLVGTYQSQLGYQEATIAPQTPAADAVGSGSDYAPAPVPDVDQSAPVQAELGPPQPEFKPGLFTSKDTYRGEGYTPGSSVQATEQRNAHPAPGILLNVPLE